MQAPPSVGEIIPMGSRRRPRRRPQPVTVESVPFARNEAEDNWLAASGNNVPHSIWSDGTAIWVADTDDDKIYAYNMPPGTSGPPRVNTVVTTPFTRNPAEDFNGLSPTGDEAE